MLTGDDDDKFFFSFLVSCHFPSLPRLKQCDANASSDETQTARVAKSGKISSGSRGPGGPSPLCPQEFFKIMQFSGNFKGKPLNLSKFWTQGPPCPWGQDSAGPPDQNPESAPGKYGKLYANLEVVPDVGSSGACSGE